MKTRDFSGIRNNGPLPKSEDVTLPSDLGYLLDDYIESTLSLLEELEKATLGYESCENRSEDSAVIKRILHKLKGEAGIVGADDVNEICHQAETAFEELLEKRRPDMLLRFKDWISTAIYSLTS